MSMDEHLQQSMSPAEWAVWQRWKELAKDHPRKSKLIEFSRLPRIWRLVNLGIAELSLNQHSARRKATALELGREFVRDLTVLIYNLPGDSHDLCSNNRRAL